MSARTYGLMVWNHVHLGSGLDYLGVGIVLVLVVLLAIALHDDFLHVGYGS